MADNISAWERVKLARDSKRPTSLDYIDNIFDLFLEFHGDRLFRDDKAIVGGVALINDIPVTVIGQQKGKNVEENLTRNFGMPYPEGYRKALRLMKQAEKFHRPIICFIDTPGAFCGVEAEERGQGEAIARNLFEMAGIKVPILSILIGEGGSGGALALGVANEVWMLENSIYSILSPEGFASILYKDSKRASEAAGVMKITANDLKNLHIVERVFVEEKEIAIKQESSKQDNSKHDNTKQDNSKQDNSKQKNNKQVLNTENYNILTDKLKQSILSFIDKYKSMSQEAIVEERYQRFREM